MFSHHINASDRISKDEFIWNVFRALVIGYTLRILLQIFITGIGVSRTIPLFDIMPAQALLELLAFGAFGFCILLAFSKLNRASWLFLMAIHALYWILDYSSLGAFSGHHILLVLIFSYVAENRNHKERQLMATLFLSSIFFAAVFFKINPSYLRGQEFLPNGNFFFWLYRFEIFHHVNVKNLLSKYLPLLSIIVEVAIATLLLVRSRLAAHICIVFVLIASILNPNVFLIYFTFIPFVMLIDPDFINPLYTRDIKSTLQNPFFWAVLLMILFRRKIEITYPWIEVIACFVLLGIHIKQILKIGFNNEKRLGLNPIAQPQITLIMPTIVSITVILKVMGAPAPMGYSMFSGWKWNSPVYKIEITDNQLCSRLSPFLNKSITTDSWLRKKYDRSKPYCLAGFPTLSGIQLIKRKICDFNYAARWKYLPKNKKIWIEEDCLSFVN